MISQRFENRLPYYLLLAFGIHFIIMAFLSEGSVGGADDIAHYKFSRYAFQHPSFFLDPWAKPFFTLLMAPFAQLGMMGVRFFNIVLGLATGLLTFLTARRLNYRNPLLAIFLLVFSPLYAGLMISGMTEILFGFILILGIYLYFFNRDVWSAVIISLLPFVRTEGALIMVLFLLAFLLKRRWKAMPFLLAGFLVFSIIGSFHYGDFFWVIHTMPYRGDAAGIYGSGELLYFVKRSRIIFGPVFFFLIIIGAILIPVWFFGRGKDHRKPFLRELLIGFLPFIFYFAAHSYVWWKGKGNSVGETRVMAAVLPSAALLALFGWNRVMHWLALSAFKRNFLVAILAILVVFSSFRIQKIPVDLAPSQQLVKVAAKWIKDSEYADRKLYYFDPYLWYFLERDPNDRTLLAQWLPDVNHPQKNILAGELVFWDAHYGPNEGQVPLVRLKENPFFRQIRVFRPDEPFQVLGGHDYEIYIFERVSGKHDMIDPLVLQRLNPGKDPAGRVRILDYNDFEYPSNSPYGPGIQKDFVHAGSFSLSVDKTLEFITGLSMPVKDLKPSPGASISASLFHLFRQRPGEDYPRFIISLENSGNVYFYHSWEISPDTLDRWEESFFEKRIPEFNSPDDVLKVYIWNRGGHSFYMDDFIIGLIE